MLECILSGRGHLFCDGRHLQPGPGDVYLLPPNLPNEYYTLASDPWEKIWFNISGDLIDALVECYRLTGLVYLPHAGLEEDFRAGLEIVRAARGDASTELAARNTAIFSRMHRLRGHLESGRSPEGIRLKEYLDGHWCQPRSWWRGEGLPLSEVVSFDYFRGFYAQRFPACSVLARAGAGCGSVGDVSGAWLASAPLSPSLWT